MIILGCFFASCMGVVLGSIGAGGSILLLPILVYFFEINPVLATSYSLIIVGLTALLGCYKYLVNKQVNILVALKFSIPSLIFVYLTRRFFVPLFPDNITFLNINFSKDSLIMIIFSILMFISAISVLSFKERVLSMKKINLFINNLLLFLQASLVGFITGIVGAGGGFLIIPVLVIFNKLDMRTAVGTSLLIIFIKSIFGFIGDFQTGVYIESSLFFIILFFTCVGMFIGPILFKNFLSDSLKKLFSYFTLVIAAIILFNEILSI